MTLPCETCPKLDRFLEFCTRLLVPITTGQAILAYSAKCGEKPNKNKEGVRR